MRDKINGVPMVYSGGCPTSLNGKTPYKTEKRVNDAGVVSTTGDAVVRLDTLSVERAHGVLQSIPAGGTNSNQTPPPLGGKRTKVDLAGYSAQKIYICTTEQKEQSLRKN